MAYCPECGTEVGAGDAFCGDCGASLDDRQVGRATGGSGSSSAAPETDEQTNETADDDGVDWNEGAKAAVIALPPAFGAYIGISIAANSPLVAVLLLSWPVFAYLLYQRPHGRAMIGGAFFWLSVETFLTPLVLLVFTFSYAAEESTATGQVGAAIGGSILVVVAFVVGVPVAIVFYLLSRRLDADAEQTAADDSVTPSAES